MITREVVMDIKADKDSTPRRIKVTFDMSDLTPDQIADWAVSANGIRVHYQNKVRPKGDTYLIELSNTKDLTYKVPPCGTRIASMREPTDDDILAMIARKFGDGDPVKGMEAYIAMKSGKGIEA